MTDEPKRRGRPPKQIDAPDTEADHANEEAQADPVPEAEAQAEDRLLTFEEVAAWNRANADKLAPMEERAPKKARKARGM